MIKTFIITGGVNDGKTLFIKDLYDFLILFEHNVQGFLSKGSYTENGNKDFKLIDLSDNSEIHLSSRQAIHDYFPAGKFFFNQQAVEKGMHIVDNAIRSKCDILILDEIGPIELHEEVWFPAVKKILSEFNGILVFSVREKLIEAVIEKFKIHEAFIEDIEQTTPRKTGESILSLLHK